MDNRYDGDKVDLARALSKFLHKGQMYGDKDYYETHIRSVVGNILSLQDTSGNMTVLLCAAYLHDVLEDCEVESVTLYDLFGYSIGNTCEVLTKLQNENYDDYLRRVSQHWYAREVKLADIKANMVYSMSNNDAARGTYYFSKLNKLEQMIKEQNNE